MNAIAKRLDEGAYEWLNANDPQLLVAIEHEIEDGAQPMQIRRFVESEIGPERSALARRCEQAARHIARIQQ